MESCSPQSRSILRIERALALSPVANISYRAPPFVSFQLTSPSASSVLRQPPCKPHDSHGSPCHVLAHNINTTFPTLLPKINQQRGTVQSPNPDNPLSQFFTSKEGPLFQQYHPIITHAMPCNALSHLHQGKSPAAVAERALDMP
jgi:hypothetical protein